MTYTKQQLIDIYNLSISFDKKMDTLWESLESIFDSLLVYCWLHPIDAIKIIDEKLYEELSYILYECPEELCDFEYYHKNIKVKRWCIDSFLKICDVVWLLAKE